MEEHSKKNIQTLKKSWIRQHDQSDCGVACLASVIRYFGGSATLEQIRQASGTNKSGTTLLGLYQAAPRFGLIAEGYEADIRHLKEMEHPCILHIIKHNVMQHYVVFYGYMDGKFIISDPEDGIRELNETDLMNVWISGALLLVKKGEGFLSETNERHKQWKWIKNLAGDDVTILSNAVMIGLFIALLGLAVAIFTQKLIDEFLPNEDKLRLFVGLALLGMLLLARNGLSWIRQYFLVRQSRDFNNRMIGSFYGSLLQLSVPFFQNRKTGDLIARMNDTGRLQAVITYLIGDVIIDALLIIVASAVIMYYSFWIGAFILLSLPVFFLLTWAFHDSIREGQKEVMQAHALNESNYIDTIQGIEAIKENNREYFFSHITKNIYGHFQDTIYRLGKVGLRFSFWADCANILFIVGVLGWGSWMVLNFELMLGALVAVVQMSGQMIPSVNRLALTNLQLQEGRVAFNRMFELITLEPEYSPYGKDTNEPEREPDLNFESLRITDLSFRFPGRKQLLKTISLEVQKGELIGILGENGCGKSTLLNILRRFYGYESGNIFINDDMEIHDHSVSRWRDVIASVPQEIKIFNTSLIENICLCGLENTSEIEAAVSFCKETGFDSFFESFPQGYATLLGEEGINISVGQKQLVILARALFQKPQLLLLDEPTSSMDRETEQFALGLFSSVKEETAIIMVTHRIQSLRYADRIYILEEGKMADSGDPKVLLERDNLFSKSVRDILQFQ